MRTRLSSSDLSALGEVSTATLATQLTKRGLLSCIMSGVRPLRPGMRAAGIAVTLRYVPAREDVVQRLNFDNATNPQRLAIESLQPGDMLVVDARGEIKAGILGSILATRARSRGATGIVTDGAVRDSAAVSDSGIAVFVTATNPNLSSICHHPVDYNVEIACGGVLVRPGDVIVGDDDGVVVIPSGAAGELIEDAVKQERLEGYLLDRVDAGEGINGLYPPDERVLADYEGSHGKVRGT